MRRAHLVALLTTLFVAAVYGPASAGPLDPQFKKQTVFFHCAEDPARIGNLAVAAETTLPSWDTTPPPGSVQGGNGCATEDVNSGATVEPQKNPSDGVWEGTFTGNLNTLTVNAYLMGSSSQVFNQANGTGPSSFGIRLTVDGEMIIDTAATGFEVTPTSTNEGVTELYTFSMKNLGLVEPNTDVDGDGIGDNPFGTQVHQIMLSLDGWYIDTNAFGAWVYDTTEVPAGIDFNPASLSSAVIDRNA